VTLALNLQPGLDMGEVCVGARALAWENHIEVRAFTRLRLLREQTGRHGEGGVVRVLPVALARLQLVLRVCFLKEWVEGDARTADRLIFSAR